MSVALSEMVGQPGVCFPFGTNLTLFGLIMTESDMSSERDNRFYSVAKLASCVCVLLTQMLMVSFARYLIVALTTFLKLMRRRMVFDLNRWQHVPADLVLFPSMRTAYMGGKHVICNVTFTVIAIAPLVYVPNMR